jgi:hypothetical protein
VADRVSAPTLILWGADDRLVPSIYEDEFSKRLARTRVHIITGAGHAPHLEDPAAVAGLVRDFLTATPVSLANFRSRQKAPLVRQSLVQIGENRYSYRWREMDSNFRFRPILGFDSFSGEVPIKPR